MKIRLAGICYESLVNGFGGLRRVFFSQGCNHKCKGCFNPNTHDFKGGELKDIDELVKDVVNNPFLKGVTFSGGDPFKQAYEFSVFSKKLKEYNINIWCYTGYTFEEIIKENNKDRIELLKNIDVLVDGRFELDKKDTSLKFKGSRNQRILCVKESLQQNKAIELEDVYDKM